jgi:hypothetical protein
VKEVLETCRAEITGGRTVPMYYLACAAFLGRMGERDCSEKRSTCAARLQGSLYFSLRAAAACHKSFENNREKQVLADELINRFSGVVRRNVRGVYVENVAESRSLTHHLIWLAAGAARDAATDKMLELALEWLAWHGARELLTASGPPMFVYSAITMLSEIAASEMNNQVCLEWSHSYKGSYENAAASLEKMTGTIK